MPENDNIIVIGATFDLAQLDQEMKKFIKRFRGALETSLRDLRGDLDKWVNLRKVKVPLVIDLDQAKKDLRSLQTYINENTLKIKTEVVPVRTTPAGTTGTSTAPTLNQTDIDRATKALEAHRAELRANGLTTKEIEKETGRYATALHRIQESLNAANRAQAVNGSLSDKEINRLQKRRKEVDDLTHSITKMGVETAKANVEIRRGESFMESFGFRVGILGFGFGILGGHLQRFSQFVVQGVQSGAKLIEPLERIRNLLFQDPSIPNGEREGILAELNRLADFPGSSLETTAKTFRSLQTLGLATADTLRLLEGLTKATARSGIGAEGLDRVAAQLRDFASTGELREQEVRSIISAGGKDVADIFTTKFGGTTAAALNKAGPKAVLQGLIEGLAKLPTPLETITDKLNKIQNAITRIALALAPIVGPGLDKIVNTLKILQPILEDIAKSFSKLPPNIQAVISNLLVLLPLLATLTAGIFTIISALGIGIAAFKQVGDAVRDTRGILLGTEKTAGALTGTVRAAGAELTILGAVGTKLTSIFKPITLVFSNLVTELRLVALLAKNPNILALTRGGTTPIIGTAAGLAGLQKILALLKGGGLVALTTFMTSLGGLIKFLPRLLGLTGPIGIIVNLIIGLITNAGKARSALVDAFSALGASLTKFAEQFKEVTGRDVWEDIKAGIKIVLSGINTLVSIIGGSLLSVITTIVVSLRQIVDFFTSIVALIKDPSWENLGDVFRKFFIASFGWLASIGKLISSVILESIADAFEEFALTKGWAEPLRNAAKNLRESISVITTDSKNDINTVTESVDKLATSIKDVDAEVRDLIESFNDLALARAKQDTASSRALERFQSEQRKRAAEYELDRRIRENPAAAIPTIRPTLEGISQEAQQNTRNQTSDAIKQRYNEIVLVLTALNQELAKADRGLRITGIKAKPEFIELRKTLSDISLFVHAGQTDLAEFTELFTKVQDGYKIIEKVLMTIEGEPARKAFVKAVNDVVVSVKNAREELAKSADEQQRYKEQTEQAIQDKEREAKALAKQNKALEDNFDKKKRVAEIDRQIQDLEIQQSTAPLQTALKLRAQINKLTEERNKLESEYNSAIRVEADQNAEIQQKQAEILENRAKATESVLATIQLQIDKNKQLRASLDSALSEADKLFDRLLDIDAQRAALGLAPGTTQLTGAIGTRADLQIAPLQQQTAELAGVAGFGLTDAIEGRFTQFIADLTKGIALSQEFKNVLLGIGSAAEEQLLGITNKIIEADKAVERARLNLAQTKEGTKERTDAQQALQFQLDNQSKLNAQATIYFNRLKSVNVILDSNAKLVAEQLRKRRELNQATLVTLQQVEQELQLNLELIQAELANVNRKGGVTATPGQIIQAENDLIQRQIDLLEKRFQIRAAEIEAEKLDAERKLNEGIFKSKEEYDAEIARLNELLRLLRLIKEEQQKGLENEKDPTSGIGGAGTFAKGLDKYFDSITASINKATTALQAWFDKLVSGRQFVDAFIGLLDGTISKTHAFEIAVATAVAALGSAFSQALVATLTGGESFIKAFTRFLGQILISIGTLLIQVGTAALIAALLSKFFPFLAPILNPRGVGEGAAVAAIAVGAGMVALGALMGGSGNSGSTASTNTANNADRSTGAQRNTFEPNKDPRFVFQKTMLAQINLEIKTDDSQIIKAVINGVNQNGRLTRLIGNRKLEFTV